MIEDREREQIKQVFKENPQGFTIDFQFKKPQYKRGYYVGLTNNKGITAQNITRAYSKLKKDSKKFFKHFQKVYIGGWKDGAVFYLDLSIHIQNSIKARTMAREYRQKAIWNIKKQDSIYLTENNTHNRRTE